MAPNHIMTEHMQRTDVRPAHGKHLAAQMLVGCRLGGESVEQTLPQLCGRRPGEGDDQQTIHAPALPKQSEHVLDQYRRFAASCRCAH